LKLTHTQMTTIEAIDLIHRAQRLLDSNSLTSSHATTLNQLTDAAVSFTVFFLRHPRPPYRPVQLQTLGALQSLIIQLEKQ